MLSLANTSQALLRNADCLSDAPALLGVSEPELLRQLPVTPGLAMSELAGVSESLGAAEGWQMAFGYDNPALEPASRDCVVVFVPKARRETAMRLALGAALLKPGGRLLLLGEKREGIAGAVKVLRSLAPGAAKLDSARHCQLWQGQPEAPEPGFDWRSWLHWHTAEVAGTRVEIANLPGIFSEASLDEGSRLLLETLAEAPMAVHTGSPELLDFACGAGVLGAWLHIRETAKGGPALRVDGVDVQSQAVLCARQTYTRAGVTGDIHASNGLPAQLGRYHGIITNPPFHTGVDTDLSMSRIFLQAAARHLHPGGELRLVANRFLPYQSLVEKGIGRCRVLAENRRFRVYQAFRR